MSSQRSHKNLLTGLSLLCVLLLAASAYLFFHDEEALRRAGYGMHSYNSARKAVTGPEAIRSWMTFDFVDHVFQIPPDYLKTELGITSSRYPRITIAQAAKSAGVSDTAFLLDVQNAIATFLQSS